MGDSAFDYTKIDGDAETIKAKVINRTQAIYAKRGNLAACLLAFCDDKTITISLHEGQQMEFVDELIAEENPILVAILGEAIAPGIGHAAKFVFMEPAEDKSWDKSVNQTIYCAIRDCQILDPGEAA